MTTAVQRVIRLPNGRRVTLGTYVRAWRALLTMKPTDQVKGFDHFAEDASRILRELRRGMHDRINRHIPGYGRGRKWSHDWYRAAWRTSRDVNTPLLIVRWVPHDLRARLAHRLTTED